MNKDLKKLSDLELYNMKKVYFSIGDGKNLYLVTKELERRAK